MSINKAPAFQFYIRDWLSDTQLRLTSLTTRGIWIDLLCFMWEAPERGKIVAKKDKFGLMVGALNGEVDRFIEEAQEYKFCDISVTCPKTVTQNVTPIVTIINRRMFREQNTRNEWKKRKQKQRSKKEVPQGVTGNNPQKSRSQSSSSSSKPPIVPLFKIPLIKKDGEFELTQNEVDEWQETFPGMDVLSCIRFIRQWNIDNPERRKTRRGIRTHITKWLARDNDKGKWRKTHNPLQSKSSDIGNHICECGKPAKVKDDETGEWLCPACYGATGPTREFNEALSKIGRHIPDGIDMEQRKQKLLDQTQGLNDAEEL